MNSFIEIIKNNTIRKYAKLHLWNEANDHYFKDTGWFNSFKAKAPVDANNRPQPWLSFSANKFLEERLKSGFSIFEFGSGNSTLYFSEKVEEVISVEHDEKWYEKIKNKMPKNVSLHFKNLESDEYQNEIANYKNRFDLIIVDGRKRVQCANNSLNALKDDGVLIFDDFDRERYQSARDSFKDFKLIEFWGMSPGSTRLKSTAFFYKKNNCLSI